MTGRTLSLTLPMAPSVNASFANVPGKGRVHTASYRAWQKQALASIATQAHGATFPGTFRIAVLASDRELTRPRDCDNLAKAIADTLKKAGVIADDSHLHMRAISIEWSPELPAGTCRVTVIELAPTPLPKPAPKRSPKAKSSTGIPASITKALRAKGIRVAPDKVHLHDKGKFRHEQPK